MDCGEGDKTYDLSSDGKEFKGSTRKKKEKGFFSR